jgi:L-ascorbate metabolism protein UlaG (beta-lactamase superfamily)
MQRSAKDHSKVRSLRKVMKFLGGIVLVLGVCVGLGLLCLMPSTDWLASFGKHPAGEWLQRAERSPHFSNSTFHNGEQVAPPSPTGGFLGMFRHQVFGAEQRTPTRPIPVSRRTAADYAVAPASGLRATWIGHATVLLEIDGQRVLTGPIWSDRCSPSILVGPKRFFPPPIALADLPSVDVVVISHDHYDHLDMATVKALAARGTRFAVPLGLGSHLAAWGVPRAQISQLDWGDRLTVGNLTLVSTPAHHYSGRNPFHVNDTLWTSWAVLGPRHRVFFSGDSGYFDGFRRVAAKEGPFDLALIKIGASDPTWQDIHMAPEQAVQVGEDVGAKLMLPVHWGTFNLAYHAWNEPADRVVAAAAVAHVALVMPRPGELVEPDHPAVIEPWWR